MSAPQIPNLLSSRGGPRSRGRGRGRGGPTHLSAPSRKDQTIQATDTDAAVSRFSAVSLGYLDDPFAQYFVNGQGTRRLPIINRGLFSLTITLLRRQGLLTMSLKRNIRTHQRPRHPHQRLPRTLQPPFHPAAQTNHIPRRRHRHAIFPSTRTKPIAKSNLP